MGKENPKLITYGQTERKDDYFRYTERTRECKSYVSRVIGMTESNRNLLRIFTKIQYINNQVHIT